MLGAHAPKSGSSKGKSHITLTSLSTNRQLVLIDLKREVTSSDEIEGADAAAFVHWYVDIIASDRTDRANIILIISGNMFCR